MIRFMVGLAAVLTGVVLQGCRQAGCNEENCRAMLDACRVEFVGSPSGLSTVTCIGSFRSAPRPDFTKYCVEACNGNRNGGELAACLARGADRCRAGDADTVIAECTAQGAESPPDEACDAACRSEQTQCDTRCSGGRACDMCLRTGGSCGDVCTGSTSLQACLDCGASCGLSYLACRNRCPRGT